jgi:hypothetical protein
VSPELSSKEFNSKVSFGVAQKSPIFNALVVSICFAASVSAGRFGLLQAVNNAKNVKVNIVIVRVIL